METKNQNLGLGSSEMCCHVIWHRGTIASELAAYLSSIQP
jgi:hypothetical protein